MSVPAFLVQAFQPSALPTRFVLGALHQQALSDAGIRRSNRPLAAPRRRYLRVSLEDGDAASAAGGKSWEEPTLEEEYDAIDDVIMGRQPGQGRDKVKVFGAWLDADVAGRKAGQGNRAAGLIARAERGEELTNREKAEVIYEEAISVMRKGDYDTSYSLLEEAVSLTGEDTRRGGEFKLWAIQALQGVGRNEQAVLLLKSLKNHRDKDVRTVGAELLYIAQAPKLKLREEDFVPFPDVSHLTEMFDKSKWKVGDSEA